MAVLGGTYQKKSSILHRTNGQIGNCWDNAVAESFFKSLKVEWVYKHSYYQKQQAELSVFTWIETWYNKRRRPCFFVLNPSSKYRYIIYNNKTHYSMKKDNLYLGLI